MKSEICNHFCEDCKHCVYILHRITKAIGIVYQINPQLLHSIEERSSPFILRDLDSDYDLLDYFYNVAFRKMGH